MALMSLHRYLKYWNCCVPEHGTVRRRRQEDNEVSTMGNGMNDQNGSSSGLCEPTKD